MKLLLVTAFICLVLFACQKEPDFSMPETERQMQYNCKLVTSYNYSVTGSLSDSSQYIYDSNNRVVKVIYGDQTDSIVISYNGSGVARRSLYISGVPYGYDDVYLNTDSSLKLIESFRDLSFNSGVYGKIDSLVFSYQSGKVSKRTSYMPEYLGSQPLQLAEESLYSYTGNNLTAVIRRNYRTPDGSVLTDTSVMQYDSHPNLFKRQGFAHYLLNPAFTEGFAYEFAMLVSENNPIFGAIPRYLPIGLNFTYATDAKGNPLQVNGDNLPMYSFTYNCP